MPVEDRNQWPHIGGFTAVLDSNARGRNNWAVIVKQFHRVLEPWPQTIKVSASSARKAVLIFDGCLPHLHIDMLKEIGGSGVVVLLCMKNTSHKTKVEDMVTFGIAKTEFQNDKQSLTTQRLVLGNTDGIKRQDFSCLLKQSLEKAFTTFLNR